MKRYIFPVYAAMLMLMAIACQNEERFTIQGEVEGAKGQKLYLLHAGLKGTEALDSVNLNEKGDFRFKAPRPECYDFYRLQLGNGIINIAIDSTETVTIKAKGKNFSTEYTVMEERENNRKIRELTLMQIELQRQVNYLIKNSGPEIGLTQEKILNIVDEYKQKVKEEYIYPDPSKPYAYFALFQTINGQMIFDTQTKRDDIKCFAAVATILNDRYPHALRSMNLYNIAIKGLRNTRPVKADSAAVARFHEKVVETGIIDIELKDKQERERKLSDLKGKVVLLDFTVYSESNLAAHNFMLRELYERFAKEGFEIYQVSLDQDEHFWRNAADNLPWICVRDESGLQSTAVALYRVSKVPSYFLIDKNNVLVARDEKIENLASEVDRLLKE